MEDAVRTLFAELTAPSILIFPDWDKVTDKSRPLRLYCDVSTAGFGASLEQEQYYGTLRPFVYISRVALANEQNWTPMELEADCTVWSIRRLRCYLFGVFSVFTYHECLWVKFLSPYNFTCTTVEVKTTLTPASCPDFPSLPPKEDISGSYALSGPDNLGAQRHFSRTRRAGVGSA